MGNHCFNFLKISSRGDNLRLFIAINFEEHIKDKLIDLLEEIKEFSSQGKFVNKEHMHLTLEFLGEVDSDKISLIKEAMEKITTNPFTMELSEIGYFKRNDGYIYWIGIKDESVLLKLQSKLHDELLNKGFSLETRKYTPHLTIGRKVIMNETFNPDNFLNSIEALKIKIDKIHLMKSENLNGKLLHSIIHTKLI